MSVNDVTSYFGFAAGDMIECAYCKEWYHDCCRKIPKKYFTNEALDYFCSKVCKIESDKSISLSYYIFKYFSIFCCLYASICMFLYKSLSIYVCICMYGICIWILIIRNKVIELN